MANQPPPMSTPISNIPIQQISTKVDEDPEVSAILQEMQKQGGSPPPPPPSKSQQQYAPPPQHSYQSQQNFQVATTKPLLDYDILQKTLYVVAIAFIVFYPNIFDIVYVKFPSLEQFHTYEIFIRAVLLSGIIYGLIWKFDSPQ